MTALATAFVRVRADTSGFKADAEKGVGAAGFRQMGERHGRLFGTSFVGTAGRLLGGVGALLGGLAVAQFFKESIAEAREAVRVANITTAAIRSTGGAAHVSAGQIAELATALSNKVGVDDEAIQSGENLLLTFTNIRNATGRNNDIFNQASAAIVDLSAAMNNGAVTTDGLKGAAIQVGKALNDPIKGVTALTRVGVTFSATQKEQIANFVAAGNIMGAQKVILAELRKEFGGVAAAAADPAQRARVAWGNFQEMIGGLVLPTIPRITGALTGLIGVVTGRMVPAVAGMLALFMQGFTTGTTSATGFARVIQGIGVVLAAVAGQARAFWVGLTQGADTDAGTMQRLGAIIRFQVVPAIADLAARMVDVVSWFNRHRGVTLALVGALGGTVAAIVLYRTYVAAAALATRAWTAATVAWNTVSFLVIAATRGWTAAQIALDGAMLANPIGIIIVLVAALVAGIIYAWTHFTRFRVVVIGAWEGLRTGALAAWGVLQPILSGIGTVVLWLWRNVIYPSFEGWRALFVNVLIPVILWWWHNITEPAMNAIAGVVTRVWQVIKVIFELWQWYIAHFVAPAFLFLWHNVIEPWGRGVGIVVANVWGFVHPILEAMRSFVQDRLVLAFRVAVAGITLAWDMLRDAARRPVAFVVNWVINPLIDAFNRVAGAFGVKTHVDRIGGFAGGGRISGPGTGTSDSILAQVAGGPLIRVSNGEWVVPERRARDLGPEFMNWVIGRRGPQAQYPGDGSEGFRFALGGLIDFGRDIWNAITNPTSIIKAPMEAALRRIPGDGMIRDVAVGVGRRLLDGLLSFVGGGGGGGNISAAQTFARAQAGKPYVWAAAGPYGYDCSGLVSAAWNIAHGRNPYNHTFSTHNAAQFFPIPGMGPFTAGWTNAGESGVGGSGVGHMVARVGNLMIESRGGDGVVIGAGATSLGRFSHIGHYDRGGPWPTGTLGYNGSGRTEQVTPAATMDAVLDVLGDILDQLRILAPSIGTELRGSSRGLVALARTATVRG